MAKRWTRSVSTCRGEGFICMMDCCYSAVKGVTHRSMGEPWKCAEWREPGTGGHVLRGPTYVDCLTETRPWRQHRQMVSRGWGPTARSYRVSFWGETSSRIDCGDGCTAVNTLKPSE